MRGPGGLRPRGHGIEWLRTTRMYPLLARVLSSEFCHPFSDGADGSSRQTLLLVQVAFRCYVVVAESKKR